MRCPRCETELLPGKKFCHACGAAAEVPCPGCGARVAPSFRFCPDCGASLTTGSAAAETAVAAPADAQTGASGDLERFASRVPPELAQRLRGAGAVPGERKQVTVLFCDLADSTGLAEGLDAEDYRDLLDQYLELVFAEVYRYEGIVNQLAGDGLMALFGAPIAHEDAPERALRAALRIRESLARFGAGLRARRGLELRARIGIHTGPVVVGTVGNDLKMDYTAIGDTTNLASRLQSLAEPGSILASEATERLTRGLFDVRRAGPFEVRGKSEPVLAYEVLHEREVTSPMLVAEARGMTPFVGREAEISQLLACFDRLDAKLPQMVAVIGEAGTGKSRLLYEFRQRLQDREVTVLEGRCASLTQSTPYAPWEGLLRAHFGLREREPAASAREKLEAGIKDIDPGLDRIFPYIAYILGIERRCGEALADEIKPATYRAVEAVVMGRAQRAPVVMLIEDLHWIDEPSREMLEIAASQLDRARLMLVVSHRPDYRPDWRVRVAFTQLHLRPLPEPDLVRIVREQAGGPLPPELERRILRTSEGNPLFAEELTRSLLEDGSLIREAGQLRLSRPVDAIRIPDTVQELLGARLDRVPARAKRVAQVAAVLGRQFDPAQLQRLLAGENIDVGAALGELEARGIVHRKGLADADAAGSAYRFGESLTLEVAYESLLLRDRRQLHARVAEILEAETAEGAEPRFALLAHHHARGQNPGRAAEALLAAAERAEAAPSFGQALDLFRDAWSAAETALAERSDGGAEKREKLERMALQAIIGSSRMIAFHGAAPERDIETPAQRGRELAEKLGDEGSLTTLLSYYGIGVMGRDRNRFAEGIALIEEARERALRAGLAVQSLSLKRALGWAYVLDARFDEGLAMMSEVIAELEQHDQREIPLYLGARYSYERARLLASDLDGSEKGARETYELARAARNRAVESASAATLAQVYFLRGDYAEALAWAERGIEVAEPIGNNAALRHCSAVALGARAALGESGLTARYLELLDRSGGDRGDLALGSHLITDVLLTLGDVSRAQRVVETSLPGAGGRLREMLTSLAMGSVLARRGSHAEGEQHFRRALALARQCGSRGVEAAAELGLAKLAAARDGPGAAADSARAALELAQAAGLGRLAERASELLA